MADAALREVETHEHVEHLARGGRSLGGRLYAPKGPGPFPAIVALHGGGWRLAGSDTYRWLGPWLAARGYVVYAPTYSLSRPDEPSYPTAVHDVRAAVQFLRGRAADFRIAPDRLALMGDSAGGHLAALVGLAGADERFASRDGDHADQSCKVKVVVGVYGVYDLAAQWLHDQGSRAGDHITGPFLGKSLLDDRRAYFDASPLSYVVRRADAPAVFLGWGTNDDVVDPATQSVPFFEALKQAGVYVRSVIVEGAPHYWLGEPFDEPGSFSAFFAPRLLRFLAARL